MLRIVQVVLMVLLSSSFASVGTPASRSALEAAVALADAGGAAGMNEELQQEICFELIRRGDFVAARSRSARLSAFRHAAVVLELAGRLPASSRAEAEQLLLAARTDQELTIDWHKSRVIRLLAVAQARLGQLESAAKTAREVPDAEDRAFALRDVVRELSRRDEVALARGLADAIEENRRYGTYRQKAAALSAIALALHQRGDRAEAEALLTQAAALLPQKPGWSDGEALRDVAAAQLSCGQIEAGREMLAKAEALARGIAGAWRVSEMSAVAKAWLAGGERERALKLIQVSEEALSSNPATESAPESLALARVQHRAGNLNAARTLIRSVLNDEASEGDAEAKRSRHVRALLVWVELFGDEAVAELKP